MKKWIWTLVFVLAIGAAALSAGLHSRAQAKPDDTILEGVYAGDISLSGMTREEAKNAKGMGTPSSRTTTSTRTAIPTNMSYTSCPSLFLGSNGISFLMYFNTNSLTSSYKYTIL